MKIFFLLLVSFTTMANATTDIDRKLSLYIEMFKLQPLNKPTPKSRELFRLGQALFMDRILSGNDNISCVECHFPRNMTTDGLPLGLGEGATGFQVGGNLRSQKTGHILARNTPAVFNLDGVNTMFWDGRISFDPTTNTLTTPVPLRPEVKKTLKSALAAQAIFPIANHQEMRGQPGSNPIADAKTEIEAWDLITEKVLKDAQYQALFKEAFPDQKINIGHIGEALAEFQRVAFTYIDTAYDRYLKGDLKALNDVQKMGMEVFFNKGRCGECHQGQHLTNFEFHNIGIPQIGPGQTNGDDFGRYEWDPRPDNMYAFKVPALRNVAFTAPYMHNGTFKTLAQVVEHYDMIVESLTSFKFINNWKNYNKSIKDHNHSTDSVRVNSLSNKLSTLLHFTEEEEKALTEFMTTALSDKTLLAREVEGNYSTNMRLQLKPSGYDKLEKMFEGKKSIDTYYYFDVLLEGGFALRGLFEPIKLFFVKNDSGVKLTYREQAFKTAVAEEGVVLGLNFDRQEIKEVSDEVFAPLEDAYLDMFNRMYNYYNENTQGPIPTTELTIIKSDMETMMKQFRKIDFEGSANISDKMNSSREDLFYVPTSFNTKEVTTFPVSVGLKTVFVNLQRSTLRTETGSLIKTYAIELETAKIQKKEVDDLGREVLKKLNLTADDVGGGTPSPSELTLEVINQVYGE